MALAGQENRGGWRALLRGNVHHPQITSSEVATNKDILEGTDTTPLTSLGDVVSELGGIDSVDRRMLTFLRERLAAAGKLPLNPAQRDPVTTTTKIDDVVAPPILGGGILDSLNFFNRKNDVEPEQLRATRDELHPPLETHELLLQIVYAQHMDHLIQDYRVTQNPMNEDTTRALKLLDSYAFKGKFMSTQEVEFLETWLAHQDILSNGLRAIFATAIQNETPTAEQQRMSELSDIYWMGSTTRTLTPAERAELLPYQNKIWPQYVNATIARAGRAMEAGYVTSLADAIEIHPMNMRYTWEGIKKIFVKDFPITDLPELRTFATRAGIEHSIITLLAQADGNISPEAKLRALLALANITPRNETKFMETLNAVDGKDLERWYFAAQLNNAATNQEPVKRWKTRLRSADDKWKKATRKFEGSLKAAGVDNRYYLTAGQKAFDFHSAVELTSLQSSDVAKIVRDFERGSVRKGFW